METETIKIDFLKNLLENTYNANVCKQIFSGYSKQRKTTFRMNNLKTTKEKIFEELTKNNINFYGENWFENLVILENTTEEKVALLNCYKNGEIYLQNPSSMLPAILLNPQEKSDILDMCSAPGGKTSLMADLCNNKVNIFACELNKARLEKMKYNLSKLGVKCVNFQQINSLNIDPFYRFDKILLDTPCSGSGVVNLKNENSYKFINEENLKKIVSLQEKLLNKAVSLLKKGGELIYSTCSVLKQENEEIVKKVMQKHNLKTVPLNSEIVNNLPLLPSTLENAITVCPTSVFEGFFVVKVVA